MKTRLEDRQSDKMPGVMNEDMQGGWGDRW